jgi:hypothetical protein
VERERNIMNERLEELNGELEEVSGQYESLAENKADLQRASEKNRLRSDRLSRENEDLRREVN